MAEQPPQYQIGERVVGNVKAVKGTCHWEHKAGDTFEQYHGAALMHCNHVRKALNSCTWQDLRYMSSRCLRPTPKA